MNAPTQYTYPVSQKAEDFSAKMYGTESGKRYGEYIDRSITEKVAKGCYTHEQAMEFTLGQLYYGNDGD